MPHRLLTALLALLLAAGNVQADNAQVYKTWSNWWEDSKGHSHGEINVGECPKHCWHKGMKVDGEPWAGEVCCRCGEKISKHGRPFHEE